MVCRLPRGSSALKVSVLPSTAIAWPLMPTRPAVTSTRLPVIPRIFLGSVLRHAWRAIYTASSA
jgi:hypothetical protein